MKASDSVQTVRNIGESRAKQLEKLGIEDVNDLINYYPRDYEDRSVITNICDLEVGNTYTIRGRVTRSPEIRRAGKLFIVTAYVRDATGSVKCVWFNQPYVRNMFQKATEYSFTGKVYERMGCLQLESPDHEAVNPESLNTGRIVPVYKIPAKMSQKVIRGCIKDALDSVEDGFSEYMPKHILKDHSLCPREFAVRNIHFPENDDAFFRARRRLVFDELLFLQLHLIELKGNVTQNRSDIEITDFDIDPVLAQFGFSLTDAQSKVLGEIISDIRSGYVMNRLIQGDVGSGKTAVAMAAIYLMVINGYQAVLMAPTDVLANQHYRNFVKIFEPMGIRCDLLTSGIKKKEKDAAYRRISTGESNIVIGTHALIQDKVQYKNLGLVITDEQHRFGVRQREKLSDKGNKPHVIVMSATPIPRTLALILYGDMDISVIDELPPGRQKTDTIVVNSAYYKRLYAFIEKQVALGSQVYIICPVIEESDRSDLKAVLSYTRELKEKIFPSLRVECVHGKLKNDEKQDIMKRFAEGKIDVLVSTTVIEVGIDVRSANLMVIENADRFGLSALHQLRGRVGRGADKSYCVLVSDTKNPVAKERLKIMHDTDDGFVISEKDLTLRGPGDFFGTRQHGLPEMKIANLYKDIDILKEVQSVAIDIFNSDRGLETVENSLLKAEIDKIFATKIKKISL